VTLVDEHHKGKVRKCFDIKPLTDIFPSGDRDMAQAISLLTSMVIRIDDKLDRVLETLEKGETKKRELEVHDTVDISGSGISVLLTEGLCKGRLLHLSITFKGSYRGQLDVLGRVVRIVPKEDENDTLYLTGIEFVDLSESEKDLLVQYAFSQHRKHIRSSGSQNA